MEEQKTDHISFKALFHECNAGFLFLIENMKEGYFETDLSGTLTFFNNTFCRILGYQDNELKGVNYRCFLGKDSVGNVYQLFRNLYGKKHGEDFFRVEVITQNGIRKQVDANVFLKKNIKDESIGFGGIVRDLSKQKRIIDKLVEAGSELKVFADSLPQIVFETNESGMITFINRHACDMLGYKKREFVYGISLLQLVDDDDRERVKAYVQKCFFELNYNGLECNVLKKDGSFFPVILYANSVIRKKQPICIRGFFVDISKLKKTETQLRKAEKISIQIADKEKNVRKIFQKYVPDEVVNKVISIDESDLITVGEKKTVTILNVDIRGYSLLTKTAGAEDVIAVLNFFLKIMGTTVLSYKGMIDKYLGDGLMAIFGALQSTANPSLDAVKTAIDMIEKSDEVSRFSKDLCNMPITLGISINTGEAIVGNIGFDKKMDYTAIGEVVNNTFRLQEYTRVKPNSILICEKTFKMIESYTHESLLSVTPARGGSDKINAYEVIGINN